MDLSLSTIAFHSQITIWWPSWDNLDPQGPFSGDLLLDFMNPHIDCSFYRLIVSMVQSISHLTGEVATFLEPVQRCVRLRPCFSDQLITGDYSSWVSSKIFAACLWQMDLKWLYDMHGMRWKAWTTLNCASSMRSIDTWDPCPSMTSNTGQVDGICFRKNSNHCSLLIQILLLITKWVCVLSP